LQARHVDVAQTEFAAEFAESDSHEAANATASTSQEDVVLIQGFLKWVSSVLVHRKISTSKKDECTNPGSLHEPVFRLSDPCKQELYHLEQISKNCLCLGSKCGNSAANSSTNNLLLFLERLCGDHIIKTDSFSAR
jgi:hypothetical protein